MENEQITPRKRGGNDVSSNRRTADERAQALASTFREIRRAGFVTLGAIARELDRRQVPMARGGKKWHPTPIVQEAAAGGSSAGAGIAAGDRATNKLGPNDKVRIIVFGQPTLTGEYTLDGNGVLAFPLIGNIPASGSTTAELQKAIAAKLEPEYLINPSVSAEIVTRRPFYVIGEVQKPGNYPYVSDMTAINAVAMAGGFTYRARKNDFYIRRLDKDGRMVRIEAKAGTVLQAGDTLEVRERLF